MDDAMDRLAQAVQNNKLEWDLSDLRMLPWFFMELLQRVRSLPPDALPSNCITLDVTMNALGTLDDAQLGTLCTTLRDCPWLRVCLGCEIVVPRIMRALRSENMADAWGSQLCVDRPWESPSSRKLSDALQLLTTTVDKTSRTVAETSRIVGETSRTVEKLSAFVRDIEGWRRGQTETFEVLATSVFREHMLKRKSEGGLGFDEGFVVEVDRKHLRVLGEKATHPMYSEEVVSGGNKKKIRGFEWDGALIGIEPGSPHTKRNKTLYLIEAKTNVAATDITNPDPEKDNGVVERKRRTEEYITRCATGMFDDDESCYSPALRKQAADWLYDGKAFNKIVPVLVAHAFSADMLEKAGRHGVWCVQQNGEGFKITPPNRPSCACSAQAVTT